jgi:REP element-mobilizing transposase RayT
MSRKYKFRDNDKLYFVSFATVKWIDVFVRNEYKEIILDSLRYCQREKGLEVYAWCIMTSHIHLIIGSNDKPMEAIMRDLKSFTSRKLREAIQNNPSESRKEWLLWLFEQAGQKNSNNEDWQFWQQDNHPIELYKVEIMQQKLNYLHQNPVEAGFVDESRDWLYSSARDYVGEPGLLDIILIE